MIPTAPGTKAAAAAAEGRPARVELRGASLFVDDWRRGGGGRGGGRGGWGRGGYGSGWGGGWWWGGPDYSDNIPIRPLCPSCWDDYYGGDSKPPPGTLPPAAPFPPSVNDQVPAVPVYGPTWAWEKQPAGGQTPAAPPPPPPGQQCSGCALDAGSGRYTCQSCA